MNKQIDTTIILGPSGCGKTKRCIDEMIARLPASEPAHQLFLAPSLVAGRNFIARLNEKRQGAGICGIDWGTIFQWARSFFPWQKRFSDLQKETLVEHLLHRPENGYFQHVRQFQGTSRMIAGIMSELKQSLITPQMLEIAARSLQNGKLLALADFYKLYQNYIFEHRLADTEWFLYETLDLFRRTSGAVVCYDLVVVDGFHDFTSLQIDLLSEIAHVAKTMLITFTYDERRPELFEQTHSCIEKMRDRFGGQLKTERMPEQTFKNDNVLCYLKNNIFSIPKADNLQNDLNATPVTVLSAPDTSRECRMIARTIKELLLEGVRADEIAVLLRDAQNYHQTLMELLYEAQIPVTGAMTKPLCHAAFFQKLQALVSITRDKFSTPALMNFLRLYAEAPVTELNTWQVQWLSLRRPWTLEAVDGLVNDENIPTPIREGFVLVSQWQHTIKTISSAKHVADFLIDVAGKFQPEERPYEKFQELLGDLVDIYETIGISQKVQFDEFWSRFKRYSEEEEITVNQSLTPGVRLLGPHEARNLCFKVIFVPGLHIGTFPKPRSVNPILGDDEIVQLSREFNFTLQTSAERFHQEENLFYSAIAGAEEQLYLSHCYLDDRGRERSESFFLIEVGDLINHQQRRTRPEEYFPEKPEQWIAPLCERELRLSSLHQLCRPTIRHKNHGMAFNAALYLKLLEDDAELLNIPDRNLHFELGWRKAELLEKDHVPKPKTFSATQFNDYVRCPFLHHYAHRLRLSGPPDVYSALDKGSILHHVLANFYRTLIETGRLEAITSPDLLKDYENYIAELLEEELRTQTFAGLTEIEMQIEKDMLLKSLHKLLHNDITQFLQHRFRPHNLEISFGYTGEDEDIDPASQRLTLQIGEGEKSFRLQGRIDRIDTDPDNHWALALDYKSGRLPAPKEIKEPTLFQLPIYLMAIREIFGMKLLGAEYYSLKSHGWCGLYDGIRITKEGIPRSSGPKMKTPELEDYLTNTQETMREIVELIRKGEIEQNPLQGSQTCQYCPYSDCCLYG